MGIIGLTSCNSRSCSKNPFFSDYNTYLEAPAFDKIQNKHYLPAFKEGIKRHKEEIETICECIEAPTFDNTIWAFDKSGKLLSNVSGVFFNMMECMNSDEMQKIAEKVMPLMTAHSDDIAMNPVLFDRIKFVYDRRTEMDLDEQQIRVVEKYYDDFVRSGAGLSAKNQAKLREINERLSMLSLQFGNNLLKENSNYKLVIDKDSDLAGLPQSSIDAAAEQAKKDGMDGKWEFTLSKPSLIPFLTYSDNAMLRKEMYEAYYNRGDNNNEYDNKAIIKEILALRLQKAQLFGFDNYANYVLAVNMAKDAPTVDKFLDKIFYSANELAKRERHEMQDLAGHDRGVNAEPVEIQRSDWWYFAEKLRKAKYDFDENQIRPYLSLDNVRNGMFMAANKLYGVNFEKRNDIPVYFEGVETYEVKDYDGSTLGLLYLDFYPRESKSSGAWCTSFREGGYDFHEVWQPALIQLVMNFTPASGDTPALLTWDEAETMWHEFGHSLHAFFSKGLYSRTCGNVPHDYVELPSQIMENWAGEPEVIRMYAKHYKTGEVMPDSLIGKLENSALFNQGFNTTELIAASILDMKYHELTDIDVINNLDVNEFEKEQMQAIGLIHEIQPRYRSTNFAHVFSGGYSAGYYAYTWAEVLDKDAFNFFKESGDLFNPELAKSFRINCLQECGNDEGMVQYKKFRGQEPSTEPYLKARGLK